MNQILVTEKLYVTPELRRKKQIYRINFIISIIVIVVLCAVYIHSEVERNQEQDISHDILEGIVEEEMNESERIAASEEEDVWKIMIASVEEQQANIGQTTQAVQPETQNKGQNSGQSNNQNSVTNQNSSQGTTLTTTKKKKTKYITASNGKRYPSVGRIEIPKIGVNYAILAQASGDTLVQWLKISPCMFWGVYPNEVGNFSIAGHNYRNNRFFSKVPTLKIGDRIKITDVEGNKVNYTVFAKYEVKPNNTDCVNSVPGKENKRIVTLITCTNDSKKRVIVQAEANA